MSSSSKISPHKDLEMGQQASRYRTLLVTQKWEIFRGFTHILEGNEDELKKKTNFYFKNVRGTRRKLLTEVIVSSFSIGELWRRNISSSNEHFEEFEPNVFSSNLMSRGKLMALQHATCSWMRLNNISINIKEFITYRKKKDIQNGYVAQTQMENPGGKRYQNLVIRVMNKLNLILGYA